VGLRSPTARSGEARFFASQTEWRDWLLKNYAGATEQVVGFHKAKSGETGITYREAVDEALCFGWIDAVRRGGDTNWQIRFTPRKAKSIWSAINIRRIEELKALGRDPEQQKKYSFENRDVALAPAYERALRADRKASAQFAKMPLSHRRPAIWWVMSARHEATRQRRLATLIADSAAGRKIRHLRRPGET
jgi:uncharacterized protein YdeI (YjbR/CyaY-like superfamily)